MRLWKKIGHGFLLVGLYDVCDWFIENYPEDLFQKVEEINEIRTACKSILNKRKIVADNCVVE